jgi:dTDP-4-dehydrorhamnose 3,5-epimerase-like enzyme
MPPELLSGDLVVDDRGEVAFVNDFSFEDVKRFYIVSNHQAEFVRAWHGHRHEAKFVVACLGAALVCCVEIDDWESPSADLSVERFVLSDQKPAVLYVPPGYANGFMTLTARSKLMFFSTSTLEQSRNDDIRFPARYWDPWHVEER